MVLYISLCDNLCLCAVTYLHGVRVKVNPHDDCISCHVHEHGMMDAVQGHIHDLIIMPPVLQKFLILLWSYRRSMYSHGSLTQLF